MAFDVSIHRQPGFVRFEVRGQAGMADFVDFVGVVERETLFWSDRHCIADLRGVAGELAPEEQVFLGELVAQNLAHLARLASVVRPESITRRSENAAQQLGVQLKVFTGAEEAAHWLATDELAAPGAAPAPLAPSPRA